MRKREREQVDDAHDIRDPKVKKADSRWTMVRRTPAMARRISEMAHRIPEMALPQMSRFEELDTPDAVRARNKKRVRSRAARKSKKIEGE